MERLTKRTEQGMAYMAIAEKLSREEQEIEGSKEILEGIYAIFQKLAEYEDLGLSPDEIKEQIEILKHNCKCMEDTLERQYDNARKLLDEQEEDCDYWKREALKWANEIGEQRIGPLLWMDEERGK